MPNFNRTDGAKPETVKRLNIKPVQTDQDRRVLHGDAGRRGSQRSAHSVVVLETDLCLGCRGSREELWDVEAVQRLSAYCWPEK